MCYYAYKVYALPKQYPAKTPINPILRGFEGKE